MTKAVHQLNIRGLDPEGCERSLRWRGFFLVRRLPGLMDSAGVRPL